MSDFDLSPSTIRTQGAARLTAALEAFDERVFAEAPVAAWVSAAPPCQNRRRMIKTVVAMRATRVFSGPALRLARLNLATVKAWMRRIAAAEQTDKAFAEALSAATDRLSASLVNPIKFPKGATL